MKSRLVQYVIEALRSPRESLTRGQHFVRHSIELTVHCYGQLQHHRAEGMAAELTYRTIFSLIPVVVLGLVMFRVFGGLDEVQSQVENQLYSFFGVPEIAEGYERPFLEESPMESDDGVEPATLSVDPLTTNEALDSETLPENSDRLSREQTARPPPAQPVLPSSESVERSIRDQGSGAVDASTVPLERGELAAQDELAGTDDLTSNDASAASEPSEEDEAIAQAKAEAEAKAAQKTRSSIRSTLHEITTQVSNVDFKSIGVFGLLLFIYAAIALANSTEDVFNRIYDAPSHRPIHLRFAIHWSIITLGSGLLAMSLYLSGQVVDWLAEISFIGNFRYLLNHLLSITASWVLLFLLYALMPNTHVSVRSAAIGSFVGSILWEAAKFAFQIYVVKAVPYSAIYGSIGLIPLFLFWIYVTWLIILFGLILTYTLQVLQGRSIGEFDVEDTGRIPAGDPDWMLPITWEVSQAFESGQAIDDQSLAERLGLPPHVVRQMTFKLSDAGVLRRVHGASGEHESLTLARPAEKIRVSDVLGLAHQVSPTNQHPAWKMLAGLKKAERDAAAETTLAELQSEDVAVNAG